MARRLDCDKREVSRGDLIMLPSFFKSVVATDAGAIGITFASSDADVVVDSASL